MYKGNEYLLFIREEQIEKPVFLCLVGIIPMSRLFFEYV
jgi:hypothetical protein